MHPICDVLAALSLEERCCRFRADIQAATVRVLMDRAPKITTRVRGHEQLPMLPGKG
jgi:hypothetical protein